GCRTETWTRTRTETRQRLFDGQQAARLYQANQADLQVKPWLQRVLQILEEIERQLQVARQVLFGEPSGDGTQLLALRRRGRHQARIGARHPGDQQIAEVARQFAAEMLQILPVALQLVDHFQHAARIAGGQRQRDFLERFERERAEQRAHLGGDQFGPAAGNRLVQCGERIAHAALAGGGQDGQRFPVGLDALLPANPGHALDEVLEIHAAETEVLAARRDGRRNLVRFRGAEHEDGPRRRLFDGLEERVEGLVGDLVGFVDAEDLVAVARRLVADIFAQFAHFIDTAIAGGIDFDYVHGAAGGDFLTTGALAAGRRSGSLDAVQAARQNARDGGLPGAALTRKNVAVRDPVLCDGILQRVLDVFLIDHVGKGLWAVLSGDYLVHGVGIRMPRGQLCQAPGNPRHTNRTTTVASSRTGRGLRPSVARSPRPDKPLS